MRPLEASDARMMFRRLRDPRLYAYIDEHPPADLAELEERYALLSQVAPEGMGEQWLNWIIMDADADEPLGTLQATVDEGARRGSIAYVVLPDMWGRGIASRSAAWLLEHLRDECGVVEAQVEIHEGNARSLRLARRLGFSEVEVRPEGDHREVVLRRRLDAEGVLTGS